MNVRSSWPRGMTSTRTRRSRAGARCRICWPRSNRPTYSGWTASCCTRRPDHHGDPSPSDGPFPHGGSPFPPSGPLSLGGAWMNPTRVRTLVIVAAVCALVGWLLLRQTSSSLPPLPWTGVPALLLLAAAEAWSGRSLRSRLQGRGKPIPPIAVARMAALAKATSLAAAFVGGFAAGFLLYVASSLGKAAYRADAYVSAATFGAAVVLILAALYLEYGCRVPTPQDGPGQPPDG